MELDGIALNWRIRWDCDTEGIWDGAEARASRLSTGSDAQTFAPQLYLNVEIVYLSVLGGRILVFV